MLNQIMGAIHVSLSLINDRSRRFILKKNGLNKLDTICLEEISVNVEGFSVL